MAIALVLQTLLFQRSSSGIIYAQAQEIGISTLNHLQDDLYSFHKSIENSLIKIYNQNELIRDMAQTGTLEEHSQAAYDLAHSAFVPAQNMAALYIYTGSDSLVSFYRHAQTPKYSYPETIYAVRETDTQRLADYIASNERVMLVTSCFNASRKVNLLRYVLKLYRNNAEYIGYIVCDVDPKPISRIVENYKYSDEQIVWLQPNKDRVALADAIPADFENPAYLSAAESIERTGSVEKREAVSGYELFSATGYKYNFTAYSLTPQTLLRLNQNALFSDTLFVFLMVLLMFAVVFFFVSKGLADPMVKAQYKAQRLADEARYKALQAQVNPHFLYNTLDTMSGIAMSRELPAVSNLCRALSNIFRYSMDMDSPYATLESEISHIKNYMYIMNVRMNNSIGLAFEIESSILSEQVPRLSIQPLVENAVNHGLKNKRGEKEIIIGASRAEDKLTVFVKDNGVGMDAQEINKRMRMSVTDALNKSSSVGLDNINARLKLLYGEEYGLEVESDGNGSCVSMNMPARLKGANADG
jgi:sensor histidine kinase YesM